MLQLVNTRFRSHVSVKDLGSVTLGFLDATIALPGDVSVEVNDMVVRLTVDGLPSVSLPRRKYATQHGERSATILRFDELTYGHLVRAAFAIPSVNAAVAHAERIRAEMKKSA